MWARFKSGELGRRDHDRLFFVLFLPYALFSIAGGVLIQFELGAASDSMFKWAIGIFFPLWLLVIVMVQLRSNRSNPTPRNKVVFGLIAIILSTFASAAGFGYMNIFNAITGEITSTQIRGNIVGIKSYSGGWSGSRKIVVINYHDRLIELAVSANEFERLSIGDNFCVSMFLGGLDYYYRWERGFWK